MAVKLKDIEIDENSRDFIDRLKVKLGELRSDPKYEQKKAGLITRVKLDIIKEKAEGDLYFFVDKILGIGQWKEPLTGRKRLDPILHGKMCRDLMRMEDLLMLYARNHMKSTMMKAFICWLILKNPLIKIALFSLSRNLSKKQLKSIKAMLNTPLVREIWELPARRDWQVDNSTQMVIKRPEGSTIQESQIDVWGIDNNIAGHHYDLHCYDDIIDDKICRSATQIEKIIGAWQMLQVVRDKSSIEVMVGTFYHRHDIYNHIIREKIFKKENTIIRPCWDASLKPVYSLYTKKDLLRLKSKMGDQNFATQMELDPVSASEKVFTPPYPIYDIEQMAKIIPPQFREYYGAIDPAATANRYSDQSGISIGFVDVRDPRCLFLERSYGVKMKPDALADEFIKLQLQYGPKVFGIETGLQAALQTVIQLKIADWERVNQKRLPYSILPISTGNKPKVAKFSQILAPFLNDRRIIYPGIRSGGDLEFLPEFKKVEMQLNFYNPLSTMNEDDIIDSQNMIIQSCRHFSQAHWFGVKHEETLEGWSYDSIYKQFYAGKDGGWGSNMRV